MLHNFTFLRDDEKKQKQYALLRNGVPYAKAIVYLFLMQEEARSGAPQLGNEQCVCVCVCVCEGHGMLKEGKRS